MTKPIDQLLNDYHEILANHKRVSADLKAIKEEKYLIECKLIAAAEETGLDGFSNDKIAVRATEKMRIEYDPDNWHELLETLISSGNSDLLMRKIIDSRALALLEEGKELPKGLRVGTYTKIGYTNK